MSAVNLFVLGVQKCGTTSLAELLGAHPDIYCPPNKETYFFCDEAKFARGTDWYEREYYGSERARTATWRVDATPFHLASETALQRIAAYADKGARFIVILREPVSRALSAYAHQLRLGHETLGFDAALAAEEERIAAARKTGGRWWRHAYVTVGRYGEQLERAAELLGRDRLLVVDQRDLADPDALAARLQSFIGLPTPFPPIGTLHANPSAMPSSRLLSKLLTTDNPVKRLARRLVPRDLRARLSWAVFKRTLKPAEKPVMSDQTRVRLEQTFASDQARLAALLGKH